MQPHSLCLQQHGRINVNFLYQLLLVYFEDSRLKQKVYSLFTCDSHFNNKASYMMGLVLVFQMTPIQVNKSCDELYMGGKYNYSTSLHCEDPEINWKSLVRSLKVFFFFLDSRHCDALNGRMNFFFSCLFPHYGCMCVIG